MPFGRKSPLEALALPGVILAYKYSQFRQRRREAASRRVTERELAALHHKIDKLLSKLEESEPDPPTSQEDECVICINARATMQTSPCGHRVVCRRCFVKTIQSAVAQRLLPLRCVICRARVNRLTSSSGTWRIQESASSYSMGAKSWSSAGVAAGGVSASASSYSMGDHVFHQQPSLHGKYPRSPNGRVAQSASLYSMSSTGSSSGLSGVSHMSAYSKTSSISSSGLCSTPVSPISPSATSYTTQTSSSVLNNHLAPPQSSSHSISHHSSLSPTSGSRTGSSSLSSGGSLSPRGDSHHTHSHHAGCPSGCSGAIPRKPLNSLSNSSSSGSCSSAGSGGGAGNSTSFSSFPPSTHTYPGRRHTKGRLMDLQNRLPPIKEFRSPAKVPHPSPVHMSNPRFRYSSYTKSATNSHEIAPLLSEPPSPPKRPMNIIVRSSSTTLGPPPLKAGSAKISPMKNTISKNAYIASKDKKANSSSSNNTKANNSNAGSKTNATTHFNNSSNSGAGSNKKSLHDMNANATAKSTTTNSKTHSQHTSSSSRSFPLFTSSNHKEKADNKKNESVERKKKDEKQKLKAEKEARKEEKRLVKEEERMAKIIAKEEKKKGKKESKELLIANDGNNKK